MGVDYLARYHLTYDQVLARADFSLTRPESGVQQGNPLGELVADASSGRRGAGSGGPRVPTVAVTATACCGPICLRGYHRLPGL